MACAGFALLGVVGLAIDLGRIFTIKTETQAYTDAAALAAAIELDGTASGITAAQAAVTSANNTWNFNTTAIPAPTVEFAQSLAGPWSASPGSAAGYTFARVAASVSAPLAFMPVVMPAESRKFTQTIASRSVAAQIDIDTFPKGLAPYTAVSTNTMGPDFGLTAGAHYSMQWPQFNGTRQGCDAVTPEKCFNADPCEGDSDASLWAVASNWASANNGYWGFQSNQEIKLSVLDGLQTQPISVGTNISPILSNGNKAAQADVLDLRVQGDADNASNVVSTYLASSAHNGRRLMVMPIVNPASPTSSTVSGFGEFLLLSNGSSSNYYKHETNGNDPFCAIYVGPYVLGGTGPGGATNGTGAYRVKLVE